MISAQTRSAFVARENRCTLFRIMRKEPRHPGQAEKATQDLNLRRFSRD
jgi:hypothetical protein